MWFINRPTCAVIAAKPIQPYDLKYDRRKNVLPHHIWTGPSTLYSDGRTCGCEVRLLSLSLVSLSSKKLDHLRTLHRGNSWWASHMSIWCNMRLYVSTAYVKWLLLNHKTSSWSWAVKGCCFADLANPEQHRSFHYIGRSPGGACISFISIRKAWVTGIIRIILTCCNSSSSERKPKFERYEMWSKCILFGLFNFWSLRRRFNFLSDLLLLRFYQVSACKDWSKQKFFLGGWRCFLQSQADGLDVMTIINLMDNS